MKINKDRLIDFLVAVFITAIVAGMVVSVLTFLTNLVLNQIGVAPIGFMETFLMVIIVRIIKWLVN